MTITTSTENKRHFSIPLYTSVAPLKVAQGLGYSRSVMEFHFNKFRVFSGSFRIVYFTLQSLPDLAKSIAYFVKALFLQASCFIHHDPKKVSRAFKDSYEFAILLVHDLLNIFKGAIDTVPLAGNSLTFLFDQVLKLHFCYNKQEWHDPNHNLTFIQNHPKQQDPYKALSRLGIEKFNGFSKEEIETNLAMAQA